MEGDLSSVKLYLVRWIWKFIPDSRGHNLKSSLLRWAGAKVGKNVILIYLLVMEFLLGMKR